MNTTIISVNFIASCLRHKPMQKKTEYRTHKRFNVQDDVSAILGSYSYKIGQLIDISQGGIAFYYKEGQERQVDSCELSILFGDNNSLNHPLFKFNTTIVSNIEVVNENKFNSAVVRRCGLQFSGLTYYQKNWLDDCIQNLTTGECQGKYRNRS